MPTCITGVVVWTHGRYTFGAPNNSIILTPFGDGYQQVQDSCAAVSNFVENYNQTETFVQWRIFQDPVAGYKLHMWRYDGTPVAPQFLVSQKPNMLPTRSLRNVTAPAAAAATTSAITTQNKRDVGAAVDGPRAMAGLVGAGLLASVAGILSLM